MKISVVIPTFNREALLGRALDSVAAQSMQPVEVIVVDDGSTDSTADAVRRRHPHVRYLSQPNRGVSRARNVGIRRSTGDWVALLDSDDEWLPGKLEAQAHALTRSAESRVCHTNEIWVRNGRRVNPMNKHRKSGGWIYRNCLPLCVISPSSVLIHRSVFSNVGYFDEQLPACEDYDLWLRMCAVYPVLYLDQPLVRKYGGHDDQLSRKHWGMDRFRITAMEKMLRCDLLDADDRAATVAAMLDKLRVVSAGADKRGNLELAQQCAAKIDRYQNMTAGGGPR